MKSRVVVKNQEGKFVVQVNSNEFIKPYSMKDYQKIIDGIKWTEEIELQEAYSILEKAFYPFKKV